MNAYLQSLICYLGIAIIGVVSIFPLTGMTGLFSFGQAAYMAIGAYVSSMCALRLHLPFVICLILGVAASGLVALVIGYPTLKLRRDYFALMSLALGDAIVAVLNWLGTYTGGAAGLSGIPKTVDIGLIVISTIFVVVLVAAFKKSRYGRMSLAIKTDELAAKSFGISVFGHKMKVYVFTSMISGFAGVLYAFYATFLDPSLFGWTASSEWVIFLFFGGVNSLSGSILSTVLLYSVLPAALMSYSDLRIIIYSVLVLLVLNFKPGGLMGEKEISFNWVKRYFNFGKKTADQGGRAV